MKGELQRAAVTVDSSGFSPAVLVKQRGIQTEWTFNLQTGDPLLSSVIFPSYGIQLNMESGENSLEYVPSGDFVFFNADGRAIGMVMVFDDIDSLTPAVVVEILESFAAPTLETALVPN